MFELGAGVCAVAWGCSAVAAVAVANPVLRAAEEEAAAKNMAIRRGCQHRARLGGKGGREGSWEVCLDDATMREGTCVVYSFGVRDD